MGKHPVQQDPYPPLAGLDTQPDKILLRPQHGVYAPVVCRVVTVIAVGLKDGIQIQAGYPHLLQIVQFLLYAPKIPAEIVIGAVILLPGSRLIFRLLLPVFMQADGSAHGTMIGRTFLPGALAASAKPVGENLVAHAVSKPVRSRKIPVIHGDLPALPPFRAETSFPRPAAVPAYVLSVFSRKL